jgi:hypothetical protein
MAKPSGITELEMGQILDSSFPLLADELVQLRNSYRLTTKVMLQALPFCGERSFALTNLRQSYLWAATTIMARLKEKAK